MTGATWVAPRGTPAMSLFRRMLVHVGDHDLDVALLRFAARLARYHGAHLDALQALQPPGIGAFLNPETAAVAADAYVRRSRDREARALQRAREASAKVGYPIECRVSGDDPLQALIGAMRKVDLAVALAPSARDDDVVTTAFASRLVVRAACPLLFVPRAAIEASCGSRILVACTASRESARALRDALPLLRLADSVALLRFEPRGASRAGHEEPLDAVASYLAFHGITATCTVRSFGESSLTERLLVPTAVDASLAELLLSHASDADADLVVMGAYGHSIATEFVLGGVTRSILGSMTVPVLMSH